MRIYDTLAAQGGRASLESLAMGTEMDDVTLRTYLTVLKGFGEIQEVEKKEGDEFITFFSLSTRGLDTYESLRSRLGIK